MIHFDLVWQVLISFDHLQTKHIWTCFNLVHPCSSILTCLDLFCPVLNHVNFILTCFEPLTNFNRFRPVLIRFDLSHKYWPILSVSTLWKCFDPFWPGFHPYSPGFTRFNASSPVFTYLHPLELFWPVLTRFWPVFSRFYPFKRAFTRFYLFSHLSTCLHRFSTFFLFEIDDNICTSQYIQRLLYTGFFNFKPPKWHNRIKLM